MTIDPQEIFNKMPDNDNFAGTWRDTLGTSRLLGLIPDSTLETDSQGDNGFEHLVNLDPLDSDDAQDIIKIMLAMLVSARRAHMRCESSLHSSTAGLLTSIANVAPDDLADVLRQQANTINTLSAHSSSAGDELTEALLHLAKDRKNLFIGCINAAVEAKEKFVSAAERAVKNNELRMEDDTDE